MCGVFDIRESDRVLGVISDRWDYQRFQHFSESSHLPSFAVALLIAMADGACTYEYFLKVRRNANMTVYRVTQLGAGLTYLRQVVLGSQGNKEVWERFAAAERSEH